MRIAKLKIKNYRNIEDIDIELNNIVAVIGQNNSGKSNLLKAATLPLLSDEIGYTGKSLSWADINNDAKKRYYDFLLGHEKLIKSGEMDIEMFSEHLPRVMVEIVLVAADKELYYVKDLGYEIDEEKNIKYGILYEFHPKNPNDILSRVKEILNAEVLNTETLEKMKMNLLPTSFYIHSIKVPHKRTKVAYDTLKHFRYTSMLAERDDFSNSNERLGSKSLVNLLQMKLDTKAKLTVEKEYSDFFNILKGLSKMEEIMNWQEESELEGAKEFFSSVSILPNMPPMNSLLNSVRLGYEGEQLSSQGLGHRNIILLLVLLNSLQDKEKELALSLLTMEEPEAHLCINNKRLLVSYVKNFMKKNEFVQLLYSTHSADFVNKLDFNNLVVMNNGNAFALSSELDEEGKDYLSKNPNFDIYKLLFSRRCILVEGLTDELFIRAYLDSKAALSDIEVISFHKGFKKIMDIWLKVNEYTSNRLGIVRDFDSQIIAKEEHEKYNKYSNICVKTTEQYTLEPEIINTGDNFDLLKEYFRDNHGFTAGSKEELAEEWESSKAAIMLQLCKDLAGGDLEPLEIPKHIKEVLEFLQAGKRGMKNNEN